ncbi:Gfo/Idh/MocA family protein, partial [Aquiflexum sp.]|uniref:Gfo/Idh/MocA family protein n=1 Tax=Aquiflexum sp. TaxID=1872584 RepID=UPI003593E1A7
MSTNRRDFLKTGATAALCLSSFTLISPHVLGKSMGYVAPSDKVNLACVGIGNRGNEIIKELNKTGLCNIVALCDVDMGATQTLEIMNMFPNAKKYHDFRKMFDEIGGDFDAVSIATPDFSHFPVTMMALAEGKHVYVEKPMARTFQEV